MLNEDKNRDIRDYLKKLNPTVVTDYSLWKATKKLNQPQRAFPPIRKENGSWARSEMEKANTFATHLAKVFKPIPRVISPEEEEEEIHSALNITCKPNLQIKNFTDYEVITAIRKLKPKKSPGYDLITGQLLKELSIEGITFLKCLFNAILRIAYLPTQ